MLHFGEVHFANIIIRQNTSYLEQKIITDHTRHAQYLQNMQLGHHDTKVLQISSASN